MKSKGLIGLFAAAICIGFGAIVYVSVVHDQFYEYVFLQQDKALHEALDAHDLKKEIAALGNMRRLSCGKWLTTGEDCR